MVGVSTYFYVCRSGAVQAMVVASAMVVSLLLSAVFHQEVLATCKRTVNALGIVTGECCQTQGGPMKCRLYSKKELRLLAKKAAKERTARAKRCHCKSASSSRIAAHGNPD